MEAMSATRACHVHGTEVVRSESCPACLAWFETRPKPEHMTPDERVAEFDQWYGVLEVTFTMLHQRIEELVGRSVWPHELVDRDGLREEARARTGVLNMDAVLGRVPAGKPVVTVVVNS